MTTPDHRADIAMLRDALSALLGAISGKPDASIGLWHAIEDGRQALAQTTTADAAELRLPSGLMFDAFGDPRTRYVRVSLSDNHCIMHPSEGDTYLQDARDCGDDSAYIVADVYLSEREFDDLPEHAGF